MTIPLSGPDVTQYEIDSVLEVLKTPNLSLGPKLLEFEHVISDYVGSKYAVAVNSGTSGLHLAVKSLGLKKGDEVITSPFSFVASANCLLYEDVKPVFVDIDPKTLNIDTSLIEPHITDKTKAILPIHVFGLPCEMDISSDIAKRYKLEVIEDSCEALGATYKGKSAGNLGDVGVFAFYPNKQITTGEGGIVCTDNGHVANLCRSLRNQGRDEGAGWLQHKRLGYNYRLSDINCALGIAQMSRLDEILSERDRVANLYENYLSDIDIILPQKDVGESNRSWFVYVIQLSPKRGRQVRDRLLQKLRDLGISCSAYFTPIHLQPYFVKLFGYQEGDFPITENVANNSIALPFYNRLSESEIAYIADNLSNLLKEPQK